MKPENLRHRTIHIRHLYLMFLSQEIDIKLCQNLMSRFKPALNLNRVLADLNCGSNSLNSISGD